MGRMMVFIMIIVGLMVIFNFAGLIDSEGTIVGQFRLDEKEGMTFFKDFDWFNWFKDNLLIMAGVTTGILIGTLGKASPETVLSAAIVSGLFGAFIGDLALIGMTLNGTNSNWTGNLVLVLIPLMLIGYVITMWDWMRGRD